jgi:anti-sigma regulatory factor (Ser/Thr protein kinase)
MAPPRSNESHLREVRQFPPDPHSASNAREYVRRVLRELSPEPLEVAVLLTSELVSNALVHGNGPVTVGIELERTVLRVGVTDESPHLPIPKEAGPLDPHGRGLFIVGRLSAEWHVERDGKNKTVVFSLDVTPLNSRET